MRIHTLSLLNMVCFYALNSSYMLKILLFQNKYHLPVHLEEVS